MEERALNILVTGATSGIGRETALELAEMGHLVLVHGRNEGRLRDAVSAVAARGGPPAEPFLADFASLDNVRELGAEVSRRFSRLDVLINNAGVYVKRRTLTTDGLEMTFQVNHLAHFLLTSLLMPLLRESAPARVITVSSGAHFRGTIDVDNLQGERRYDPYGAYAASKLANVMFTYSLARDLDPAEVTANCLHPGSIATHLLHEGFPFSLGAPVERGAETPVYLATSAEVAGVTGTYFVDRHPERSSPESYDEAKQRRLWEVSERLSGIE